MAEIKTIQAGHIVIGTGVAGLLTALSLAPDPVLLISAGKKGSSDLAQGGIAAAIGEQDSPELHARDTITASSGLCDETIAHLVAELGRERVLLLQDLGVAFDLHPITGQLCRGKEAAHSCSRILHCNGDGTGREVTRALWERVHKANHITVFGPALAEKLIQDRDRVCGVVVSTAKGRFNIEGISVVLATGGIGQLYQRTTNPEGVSGLGLGMAIRAGADVTDLEFVQFHPTAFDLPGLSSNPLATEALRGEGAFLLNGQGQRFMVAIHPDAELAPRDVVARAVYREVQETGKVFLDATKAIGETFPEKFPTVYQLAKQYGIDPVVEPIPVAPAAHYHMGGVTVDAFGRTSLPGLWAVGEVACTGLHGANRLASNSLLEALVFAPIVAKDVRNNSTVKVMSEQLDGHISHLKRTDFSFPTVPGWLRQAMYCHVGVVRDEAGLSQLETRLLRWSPTSETEKNLHAVASSIVQHALARRESRGGHFRSDYPITLERYSQRGDKPTQPSEKFSRKAVNV